MFSVSVLAGVPSWKQLRVKLTPSNPTYIVKRMFEGLK